MERKNHGSRMDAPQFGRHDALPAAMGALWVRLSLVIPFCMLFAHKGYIAQYRFFRRRMGHSVLRSFWLTYQNHCRFAEIILDRFYVYAGGNLHFDIPHYDRYTQLANAPEGFVILSAHVE